MIASTLPLLELPQYHLRDYQQQAVRDLYRLMRDGERRVLLVAPTGAGKTVILAKIIADAHERGRNCLFLVHADVLVAQTIEKLVAFGLQPGVIKAEYSENRSATIQVASIQSLGRRNWISREWLDKALIIFDEAHVSAFSQVGKQLAWCSSGAWVLGATATPWRLSKHQSMAKFFDAMVCTPLPRQLMEQGFLVWPRYFGFAKKLDLSGARTRHGDYISEDLALVCDQPDLIDFIVGQWQKLANDRRTICFGVNVAHSQNIRDSFAAVNVAAAHIDGSTNSRERSRIYQALADGKIRVLSSCEALGVGFDMPSIECVLLCRPTKSRVVYFQQIGRGLRLSPGTKKKDCIVLDQAGNVSRFGFVEDLSRVDVELSTALPKDPKSEALVKECPNCFALIHLSLMECRECGYVFPVKEKIGIKQDLVELKPQARPQAPTKTRMTDKHAFRIWLKLAYRRRLPPVYAIAKYKKVYGAFPPPDTSYYLGAIFAGSQHFSLIEAYETHLKKVAPENSKDRTWLGWQLESEFGSAYFEYKEWKEYKESGFPLEFPHK